MPALELQSVSKCYAIRSESGKARPGFLGRFGGRAGENKEFWALRNVSFQVARGEALGIIGHNGAGKSTILKLLSNITTPTKGRILIDGRISALLEVGSGFHPELTGRENVYLSGSILGMRRAEITTKLDSIVEFAEVRQFLDIPVKRYSSGMFVRLGFSIAAHLDPDILLLDEVLAVGDQNFQQKCKERIAEMHRRGTTMVFISHDLHAVRSVCDRVLLLKRGEVLADGTPDEVIQKYVETASFHQSPQTAAEGRIAEITGVTFFDEGGEQASSFKTGYPLSARVESLAYRDLPNCALSVYFLSMDGKVAAQWTTNLNGEALLLKEGSNRVEFATAELGLQPGIYSIDICIEKAGTTTDPYEWQHLCSSIHVEAGRQIRGEFYMPHSWRKLSHGSDDSSALDLEKLSQLSRF